ncbi:hypothetical protein D3C87_358810 [compost metagenome]
MSRCSMWLCKPVVLFALALPMAYLPIEASAACSDSRVKRLSRQGKTVTSIARTCDMDADEVREILEEEDGEAEPTSSNQGPSKQPKGAPQGTGLGPGTPLAACGCWGPVPPNYRESNQACRSGYAMPRMCPQMCPAGGYAWQGVCG